MRINFLLFTFVIPFALNSLFALPSEKEKVFVKGSLSDKINLMKESDSQQNIMLAKRGIDFVTDNYSLLSSDEDFLELTKSSILALPVESEKINQISKADLGDITKKLIAIFEIFKNKEVKAAVLSRINYYSGDDENQLIKFLNDYLSSSYKSGQSSENVLEEAIVTVGKIGNAESLSIIYSIWASKIWKEYQKSTDKALVQLSETSFADVIKIFSISRIENCLHYFNLLKNSKEISENSLCDIAENALLIAINNAEKQKEISDEDRITLAKFQLETQKVLSDHKWSHSSSVINRNMLMAKKAYDSLILSDDDFVSLISSSVNIPSQILAQILTDFLSECNGKVESASKGEAVKMPAKPVVLALISALGALGDKTAFDALLYVTYLTYPEDVIESAKASLQSLNW